MLEAAGISISAGSALKEEAFKSNVREKLFRLCAQIE